MLLVKIPSCHDLDSLNTWMNDEKGRQSSQCLSGTDWLMQRLVWAVVKTICILKVFSCMEIPATVLLKIVVVARPTHGPLLHQLDRFLSE
jgi:hypothetical protein